MKARTAALGLVAATAALVLALPALGGTTAVGDPNDARGRLDVRSVLVDGTESPFRWRVATFGGWTIRELWDRGYVVVQLDTKGDARIDRLAVVSSNGRDLIGTLNRVRDDGRLVELGRFRVDKGGRRSVALSIALHRLAIGPHRTSFSWNVITSYLGDACPRTCFDAVPDAGIVEQPLPMPSPSPTPSPTPAPSPSPTGASGPSA